MLLHHKKGVSAMVSYVLLVVFAIVMGAVIFAWLKSYSPTEGLNCNEGASVFLKTLVFNNSQLNLTTKNNGRFNIAGYFIHASNNSSQALPNIDLSIYLNESYGGKKFGSSVLFALAGEGNTFSPGDQASHVFDLPPGMGDPYSISIIPTRFQEENNRERFVSCSDAVINQVVGEPIPECIPESLATTCGARECGNVANNCGDIVSCPPGCTGNETCSVAGVCTPPPCTDTCSSLGYQCGTQLVCGINQACGACSPGNACNATGSCIPVCTDTCTSLGFQCGVHTICGVNQTCGSCTGTNTCSPSGACVPPTCTDTCSSLGFNCGIHTVCGVSQNCGACTTGSCNSTGQCVCTDTCSSLGFNCGTQEICGVNRNCGSCSNNLLCTEGVCSTSCNGQWQLPESSGVVCDGGPNCLADCTCPALYVPDSFGGCRIDDGSGGLAASCIDWCLQLQMGYTASNCPANSGQCVSQGGDYQSGGNAECRATGGNRGSRCCCFPSAA